MNRPASIAASIAIRNHQPHRLSAAAGAGGPRQDEVSSVRDSRAARPRLLIAEDDEPFRQLLAHFLRKKGAEVIEASSGTAMIELLGGMVIDSWPSAGVDAIVTDIRMPGMTGLDIVRELRRGGWAVPVVLITAFGDAGLHRQARELGAELLDKPFQLNDLLAAIERIVDVPWSTKTE